MKYENNNITDLQIAYIGGGSRGWAWAFMSDLALESRLSGTIHLYDIDIEAAKSNQIIGRRINEHPDTIGKWNYQVHENLSFALKGADIVVISILPGTFKEMGVDVHLPERLGIYQSVGDTVGPGGMIRALRTIPEFIRLGKAIKDFCPEAWVINYTNPMSLCIKSLYYSFPEIKAFGCCHEVFGTQELLKEMVREKFAIDHIDRRQIQVNVLGINHFTWFDAASYKGIDLFPIYRSFVEQYIRTGYPKDDNQWEINSFASANLVKFDLFQRYGLIAAAGDRHLAEFVSSEEYLKDPATVARWKFGLTTVDWRIEDLNRRLEKSAALVKGKESIDLKNSGEEGVLLIKALCGLERIISNVNIPNHSLQIQNLPATTIVETNAVFELGHIRPIVAGSIPSKIKKLIQPHLKNQELIFQAALTLNKNLVYEAFFNDPLVKGANCFDNDIITLVDDMIDNPLEFIS
jgi:alpha-galactosidase